MRKTKKYGCLKAFLIAVSIAFLLVIGGVVWLIDAFSGNADRRKEARINKELVRNMKHLPEKYASYTDLLSELRNSGKYEIDSFGTLPDKYCFLSDSVLVMATSSTGHYYKINKVGEIIDRYHNPELRFYGPSLMEYTSTQVPQPQEESDDEEAVSVVRVINSDIRQYVLSGHYNNWPLDGDTTLRPIVPISEIASHSKQIISAYEKADIVEKVFVGKELNLLYTGKAWYASDVLPLEDPQKYTVTKRSADKQYLDKGKVKIQYLHNKEFHRATSGFMGGGSPRYYAGDAYLEMMIIRHPVSFKIHFTKTPSSPPEVELDIIRTAHYAIVNNYLIKEKMTPNDAAGQITLK